MAAGMAQMLFTTGLPQAKPAEFTELGQYLLATPASVLDPIQPASDAADSHAFKATDISRLKGQELTCAPNAKLIAVNLRWITYAMKEGNVRAITQNAKESLKLSTLHKAMIIDLVMLDKGGAGEPGVLVCLDEAAHVTVFELSTSKKLDIEFYQEDAPHRVVMHPVHHNIFMLMHTSHIDVWSLTKLKLMKPSGEDSGFLNYLASSCTSACSRTTVSDNGGLAHLRDVTFSVSGSCIVALSDRSVFTYLLASDRIGETDSIQQTQQMVLSPAPSPELGFHSVHVLGGSGSENGKSSEVLVLASRSQHGCDLLAYWLEVTDAGSSTTCVISQRLCQSVHIDIPSSAAGDPVLLDVNREPRDMLCIAFEDVVLVMPLALSWSAGARPRCLPFPNVRRIRLPDPVHQLTTMLGKSFSNAETALFLFSATNFTREKDKLPGCNVVVNELRPDVIQRIPAAPLVEQDDDAQEADDADDAGVDAVAREPALEPPSGLDLGPVEPLASDALESACSVEKDVEEECAPTLQADVPDLGPAAASSAAAETDPPASSALPDNDTCPEDSHEAAAVDGEAAPWLKAEAVPTPAELGETTVPLQNLPSASEDVETQQQQKAEKPNLDVQVPGTECDGEAASAANHDGAAFAHDLKACAASFVKGLEKRRPEMAERLLSEVAVQLKATLDLAGAERDLVEQALSKVHEARELQAAGERGLGTAVKKASDTWFDASAAATQGLLQKELTKISDGIASSLAQQLSQSRKFSEAIARGVQRSSGAATKQALEALRPTKALQESLSSALTDGLNESLAPVLRAELRTHFEQELAPLIAQRVGEMMSTLRDKMGECLEGIAAEHEQAAQRLARDIGPVVAQELRDVERILARRSSEAASGTGGLSEEQLDELVQSVQSEIVAPLHGRIRDLTAQVRKLREDSKDLERRWAACQAASGSGAAGGAVTTSASASVAVPVEEEEAAHAKDVERLFREGREQDAFVKAMKLQQQAKLTDFLGRLCALAGAPADWLEADGREDGCPLSMPVKMLLMLSLAQQLEGSGQTVVCSDAERTEKVEWINELWFAFDPQDSTVSANSGALCTQLMEALEKASESGAGGASSDSLRKLKKGVRHAARLMAS